MGCQSDRSVVAFRLRVHVDVDVDVTRIKLESGLEVVEHSGKVASMFSVSAPTAHRDMLPTVAEGSAVAPDFGGHDFRSMDLTIIALMRVINVNRRKRIQKAVG